MNYSFSISIGPRAFKIAGAVLVFGIGYLATGLIAERLIGSELQPAGDVQPQTQLQSQTQPSGEWEVKALPGRSAVVAATDKDAYDRLFESILKGDDHEQVDLAYEGRLIPLNNGTRIKYLNADLWVGAVEVRVLSGEYTGQRVWIDDAEVNQYPGQASVVDTDFAYDYEHCLKMKEIEAGHWGTEADWDRQCEAVRQQASGKRSKTN